MAAPASNLLVDEKINVFRGIQQELEKLMVQKQQLLSQFNENTLVKGELDLLADGAPVYKLVGPVLMNIELQAAKDNVGKRLQFIEGEINKVDASIDKKTKDGQALRDEIGEMQKKMQAEAAIAARAVAEAH